jgi:hypothetical protein
VCRPRARDSSEERPWRHAKWKEIYVSYGRKSHQRDGKSPDVFPRVYVAMVEAGETGGFLDVVLAQIADFQSREKEMKAVMTRCFTRSSCSSSRAACYLPARVLCAWFH